jgi:hypothetical protein
VERSDAFFKGNPFVGRLLQTHPLLTAVHRLSIFLSPLSKDEIVSLKAPERHVSLQAFVTDVMRRNRPSRGEGCACSSTDCGPAACRKKRPGSICGSKTSRRRTHSAAGLATMPANGTSFGGTTPLSCALVPDAFTQFATLARRRRVTLLSSSHEIVTS